MKSIQPSTSKIPEEITTGDVYTTILIAGDEAPQVRAARMHFAPGSRTAWHSHAGGEYLHIIEGTALMQERGGNIAVLPAGDTVFTESGVEHWHGASSDSFMVHLAVWGAPVDSGGGTETTWGSQVTDEEAEVSDKE